ncbi:MAG: terminase family protein [Acidobacteriia bacterium]|nr:terminase family protein [Terriglobia bacterium]
MSAGAIKEVTIWEPQPGPQAWLISCRIPDVFLGGGRGGGKTDSLLGDWLNHVIQHGSAANGILFRKRYKQFEEIIRRAKEIYLPLGVTWKTSPPTFTWPHEAQLKLRHLERDVDAEEYQGHSYTWAGFDEVTNWASPYAIDKIKATLRSAKGVKTMLRCTGNPGGPGHSWVKGRYVDPAPPMVPHVQKIRLLDGSTAIRKRVYIPALLEDNRKLLDADPEYWQRVVESVSGNEALLKAWRWGIWDIVAGGMLDDLWRPDVHLVQPFTVPKTWYVDRSFDWGSAKPFSVGWWAESDGTQAPNGKVYPRGTLFRISEYYGCSGNPNEGLKLTAPEIARRIRERESILLKTLVQGNTIRPGPADPSIFSKENGNCVAEDMAAVGIRWDNRTDNSRKPGWQELRKRLKACLDRPMESPGMFVFDTCRDFIRTVPVLPRDERDPDDINDESEDHIADETRYRAMHRKATIKVGKITGF